MSRLRKTLVLAGTATAALEAANLAVEQTALPLHNPLAGEGQVYPWRLGCVFYTVKGTGKPVVLIHGIHAAASSFEMRGNFESLSETYRVYALDLLGFGLSDRPAVHYSDQTYLELVGDFLRDVVCKETSQPAALIANSLSGAYAIGTALRCADLVSRLILINPTGLEALKDPPAATQRLARRLLRSPIWGTALFNALASRPSLKWYLRENVYFDKSRVTGDLVTAYHTAAHQIGGKWAPASFITGYLNLDVYWTWSQIKQPTLLVWGRHAKETPPEQAALFLRLNPSASLEVFANSKLLPHEEEADRFNELAHSTLG